MICPLLSINKFKPVNCMEDHCAWFHMEYHHDGDFTDGACTLLRIADRLTKEKAPAGSGGKEKHNG